jgi:heme-degrading monooxygenase HmoA
MITRVWHGWTSKTNADAYQALLRAEIPRATRNVKGFLGARVLRREARNDEVEFVTLLLFESLQAVRGFAGDDFEQAVLMPGAAELLSHYDERSAHYASVFELDPGK